MRHAGAIALGTSSIWPFHPEKCLAVHAPWAEAHPHALRKLLRVLLRAQILCDLPAEAPQIAALLAHPEGLNLPEAAVLAALPGGGGTERIHFHTGGAWFPARAARGLVPRADAALGLAAPGCRSGEGATSVVPADLLAAAAIEEESLFFAAPGRVRPLALPEGMTGFGTVNF